MSISYNTGATASADTASSVNITIPAGVLVNDVMLMSLTVFTETSTAPTVSFSGAGGSWTLISVTTGTNSEVSSGGSIWSYGFAYYRIATSGDPGQSLTISESGSAAGTTWIDVAIAAYTGANTSSPIDVAGGAAAAGNASNTPVTCPTMTTGVANDWAVYLGQGAPGVGVSWVIPSGSTSRQTITDGAGVGAAISDSNGPVGAAGTSIGGGTFGIGSAGVTWLTAFTVGLAPAATASAPPAAPLIPPGRSSPMTWRWHTGPSQAPVLTPVSDSDAGTGADTGSAAVQAGAPPAPLTPPGRQSPQAFGWHAGPSQAPLLVPVSDADSGTGADSAAAGTPVQAYPVTPPGRQSPQAWQFQAGPSQAPVLTPVSDGDSGSGADSAAAGTPVQAWPLTPPGRANPMASRFQAFPAAVPAQVYVSDSDTGTGADTGSVSTGAAAGVLLTPPGRQNPAAFGFRAPTPPPTVIIAVSDSDTGTGADSAYAGTPVQSYPLTPPGRGNPQAPQFQQWPSDAPVLVPVSDADSGTGADSGSAALTASQPPGAVLVPPRPFTPMAFRQRAVPSQAPPGSTGGHSAAFLVFFP